MCSRGRDKAAGPRAARTAAEADPRRPEARIAAEAGTGPAWARPAAVPGPTRRTATRMAGLRMAGFRMARRGAGHRPATATAGRPDPTAGPGPMAAAGSQCPLRGDADGRAPPAGDAPKAVTVHGNAFAGL